MLLVRPVSISALDEARAFVRRVGVDEESSAQAAKGLPRPAQLLLTGLEPGVARALAASARAPEQEAGGAVVITGGGEAALLAGSQWEVFSFALRLAARDEPALERVAGAITTTLARTRRPPGALSLRGEPLGLGGRPRVMGVLNVTPDSFSDGGRYPDAAAAIEHGRRLLAEGADLLDVGGESTRPGASEVPADEEIRRVVPVIEALAAAGARVSVDTSKTAVARAALAAGAVMVNDVTGLSEPEMAEAVAASRAALVLMHMRGTPRTMQSRTDYADVVGEVLEGLGAAVARAREAGVAEDALVVDPGIGFAKTPAQNLTLLRRLPAFGALGLPVLVGTSRKSFIGEVTGAPVEARLPGTLASVCWAARAGADLVRVHDVAETVQALEVEHAIATADADGTAFDEGSRFWRRDRRVEGSS